MPIRIYALAKDLNIDSKDLVDACTKAGISGKGSALASLDDDELKKIKAYLAGDSKPASRAAAGPEPGVPIRPSPSEKTTRRPITIGRSSSRDSSTTSAPPTAPPSPSRGTSTPPAAPAPSSPPPEAPAEPAPMSRDDYIAPAASGKNIRVIGAKSSKSEGEKKSPDTEAPKKPKRRAPVINVAPMPEVKQPAAQSTANEPRAQKPEIRLPQDAIRGAKQGARAPLESHISKTEKKHMAKTAADPGDVVGEQPSAKGSGRNRRGKSTGEDDSNRDNLAGMASARADRQRARRTRSRTRLSSEGGEEETPLRRRSRLRQRSGPKADTAKPRKSKAVLELPCTVRTFSEAAGLGAGTVVMTLMNMGLSLTINSQIDEEYVDLLAAELGVELEIKQRESLEETMLAKIREAEDDPEALAARPPVVTFLGHVDHGKTSLLDRIIGIDVVSGEAGGITQHIRAYDIDKDGRKISFVDTPGHEAFTEMRARGANVTDIAVLVIAADDGIMPQTEEAISHAKAAEVPIIVALNKIDLPGADANRAMQQLTEHELVPSEWGGEVEVVKTSALSGEGIDTLLETILAVAELHEYKANPNRAAYGVCLEAEQEGGRGVIAKMIVQQGTLKVGDVVVCGAAYGRVKAMYDTLKTNVRVKEAGPSIPVNLTGLDSAPEAGESFYVLDDISEAREIASQREHRSRKESLSEFTTKISFEEFQRRLEEGRLGDTTEVVTLKLIIRADVRGSIEAIEKELSKLEHPEVQVKIMQATVGGITAADVTLANASSAVIIGFNVIPDEAARNLADEYGVEIRRYDIIYKVTEDIKAMLEGRLKPEERIVELGHAVVKQVFTISRVGTVAGCYVLRGSIQRGCRIRVNREGRTIGDYPLDTLRHVKDDVKEVPRGMECGIKLSGFNDVKKDDVLEAYKIEEVARTL